jgi:virulence-associated protein VapD
MKNMKYFVLIIFSGLAFVACQNCDKFESEHYSDADTLTLNSHSLSNVKKYYDDLKQPNLNDLRESSYRMIYRHAFEDYQRILHLSKVDSGCVLKCITMDEVYIDSTWATVAIDSTIKEFSIEKWKEFENMIYGSNFWTLSQPIGDRGLDGRTFVLEGYRPEACSCKKRAYHLIVRWSPGPGFLRDVCDSLLSYADL